MRIAGILDISTVDWYGNVSLVVFFAGCNFSCPYCQNSKLISKSSGVELDSNQLRERIQANLSPVPQLDAVVFTGGEPTLQRDGVLEAAKIVKDLGLKLMLNTNGTFPDVIESLLEEFLIDRVAIDIKAPLAINEYRKISGIHQLDTKVIERINKSLTLCDRYGIEVEVRTTIVPTLNDNVDYLERIASTIEDRNTDYYIQQFDNTGDILSPKFKSQAPPSRDKLIELARVGLKAGLKNVYVKTRADGLERIE